ncbi:MAG: nitrous oxide-stimulated promoter family protein [Chloroflexi bacterium]|nr:nitrous oxide-stimulated promoter family protein [Chloroflexota bacterium]
MSKLTEKLDAGKQKDIKTLVQFVSIYCRENHKAEEKQPFSIKNLDLAAFLDLDRINLCSSCNKLLTHGMVKLLMCPYDPKPMCKKCETHCYAPFYQQQIRQVMKFSGMYLIKHGRLDIAAHYFLK